MSNRYERIASLDFLRGAAAFLVAIPHIFAFRNVHTELFEAISVLGVEIFFVLSGYVLAPQILFCTQRAAAFNSVGIFLVRRWMRTVPAYLLALLVVSFLMHQLLSADFARYLFYVQNLFMQANSQDYFSIAWSLAVEEWFYLTFPLFLVAAFAIMKGRGLRQAVFAAIAYIAFITALRSFYGHYENWGPDVRRVVLFRVDSIAYGFLLYTGLNKTNFDIRKIPAFPMVLLTALIAFGGVWLTVTIGTVSHPLLMEHIFPFYAALFGAAGITMMLRLDQLFHSHNPLKQTGLFLGRISYSVYLFHPLMLMVLGPRLSQMPLSVLLCVVTGMTVAVATLVYTAIEAPILAARPKYKQVPPPVLEG